MALTVNHDPSELEAFWRPDSAISKGNLLKLVVAAVEEMRDSDNLIAALDG